MTGQELAIERAALQFRIGYEMQKQLFVQAMGQKPVAKLFVLFEFELEAWLQYLRRLVLSSFGSRTSWEQNAFFLQQVAPDRRQDVCEIGEMLAFVEAA